MNDKIVITKMSGITPLGNDLTTIYNKLKSGESGIGYISKYNTKNFPVKHAAECNIQELDEINYPEEISEQFKPVYYTLNNLLNNLNNYYDNEKIGFIIGTDPNIGSIQDLENLMLYYKHSNDSNLDFENTTTSSILFDTNPSSFLYYASKYFGINGPCLCNLGTCSASTQAIGKAYNMLKRKEVDMVIAGGISTKIEPTTITRLTRLEALEETYENLSDNCRPFDKNRKGFTIGEGCILFLLEREREAINRNAEILCEVSGYGSSLDGFSMVAPHEEALGMTLCMQRAIDDAKIKKETIDYINAHGTGTDKNDYYETKAIKNVFETHSYTIDISSTKSMHGHLLPASGAMSILASIIAIRNNFIPPTINYKTFDENCDLNYTPNKSKYKKINNALINSFGLGGQNASIIISKYKSFRNR